MKQEDTSPQELDVEELVPRRAAPVPSPALKPEGSARPQGPGDFASPAAVATSSSVPKHKWGRAAGVMGLVFCLFLIIFIVPAGRLPGMSRLVGWMGFSAQDAQLLSVGKALLTWAGGGSSVSMQQEGGQRLSVFDKRQTPGFNAQGPQSGLFDLAAVNASRRARGLRADGLAGAYVSVGEEASRAAMDRRVSGWSQEAQQNSQKVAGDVYFGADADVASRAAANQDKTKGSANSSLMLAKSPIAGSAGHTDWLGQAVDKAASVGISKDLDRELARATQGVVPLSRLGGSLKAGQKPQQDLARTWLLSSAANKAPQLMLKKQLAAAGYMSIEMPKKVYDSKGEGSGVMMRGDEMVANFEEANSLLLGEEECRKLGQQANSQISAKVEESQDLIRQVRHGVPTSCNGESITAWNETLIKVRQNCQDVKTVFSNMKSACGSRVKKEGSCQTVYLDSYSSDLSTACQALAAAQAEDPPDEEKIKQLEKQRDEVIRGFDQEQLNNTFNLGVDGQKAGGNDFFPETENDTWKESLEDLK